MGKGNTCLQMHKCKVLRCRRLAIASLSFVMLSSQTFQPVGDYICAKGAFETNGAKQSTYTKSMSALVPRRFKVQEEQLRGRVCRSKVNNDFMS